MHVKYDGSLAVVALAIGGAKTSNSDISDCRVRAVGLVRQSIRLQRQWPEQPNPRLLLLS